MERMKMQHEPQWEADDIEAELQERAGLLRLFRRLPKALWPKHFERINAIAAENGGDEAALPKQIEYLSGVLEAREEKSETLVVGETPLGSVLHDLQSSHKLGAELESLLVSPEASLGKGQTARIKSLRLAETENVAVKYLLTPTAKTLSADAEYDMLREVETVSQIEREEARHEAGNRVRVPHPHFFFKNQHLQCYAMEQINGVTLEELLNSDTLETVRQNDLRDAAWRSLSERYANGTERAELEQEVVRLMEAVHEVCLHGDMKMGNIMVNDEGVLYLIDFGQSVPMNSATEKSLDQFENLKELERDQFRVCIQTIFNSLNARRTGQLADAA